MCRPTSCGRTDQPEVTATKVWAYLHAFLEKYHYFRNDDPYRHKTQYMSCTWSVRVAFLRAKFRRRTTRRLLGDGPQTKQTNSQIFSRF